MAGLLDIFGTTGQGTLGLLGGDVGSVRDDAQAQALYALAGSLLSGGPTGLSIVKGLQQGQQAYKQAMRNALDEQIQGVQVSELLRKRQLEQEALARQQKIDAAVARAYQPGQAAQPAMYYGEATQLPVRDEEGNIMPGATLPVAAQAPRLDLQSITPFLMATPEGRKTLTDLASAQKAIRPETFSLAEGAQQFERDPITGEVRQVAAGLPKREPVPSAIAEYNFAVNQGYKGTFQDFELAKRTAGAPKVAVDLKDPTAVAKAQRDIVGDWRTVLKDVGAMEVADRFKAAQQAVEEGNRGNKAADGALIYSIGKIYDPSGAVQEGDKKTILGNRNIPDTIKAYAERVLNTGSDLLPTERQNLLNIATKIVQEKAKNIDVQKAPYTSLSRQLGGSGELLMNPLADVLTPQAPMDIAAAARAELARRKKGQ